MSLLLAATLVLLAAVVSPARARENVIASSVSGFEGGPALASDGRVVVGERRQGDGGPGGDGVTQIATAAAVESWVVR